MAMIFPYVFKERYSSNTCLIKIWFGKKYFFWKAKSLKQTAEQVCKDLSRKVRLGCPETDLFFLVSQYIKRGRILSCTIEVILETNDHQELFDAEAELLKKYFGTSDCLNNSPAPYQPTWLHLASNKALQSIKNISDVEVDAKEPVVKSEPVKVPSVLKSTITGTDQKSVMAKMQELIKLKNAKV